MKIPRRAALFLSAVLLLASFSLAVAAGGGDGALSRYASELSQFTSLKYFKPENTERYVGYKLIHQDLAWESVMTYVNIGLDTYFYSNPVTVADPAALNALVNKYHPLPPDYVPAHLEAISSDYSYEMPLLRHDARVAFENFCSDAQWYGYSVLATSAYRSYDRQKEVYDSFLDPSDPNSAFYQTLTAARPGYSEHQTGLAVDTGIDATDADTFSWYSKNAHKYGFIIRYPYAKEPILGYSNEPWHLRYLGVQLATAVYQSGLTYDEYYEREINTPAKTGAVYAVGVTAAGNISTGGPTRALSTYSVLGATYYRLRDIAALLNNTPMQFDIAWDAATNRITLIPGKVYTGDPALSKLEAGRAAPVTGVRPTLQAGGAVYTPAGYASGGSNYMKLEDILSMLALHAADDGKGGFVIAPSVLPSPSPSALPSPAPSGK